MAKICELDISATDLYFKNKIQLVSREDSSCISHVTEYTYVL